MLPAPDTPVTLSDIAKATGIARSTINKWQRNDPAWPARRWIVGGAATWRWDEIADYFQAHRPDVWSEVLGRSG